MEMQLEFALRLIREEIVTGLSAPKSLAQKFWREDRFP